MPEDESVTDSDAATSVQVNGATDQDGSGGLSLATSTALVEVIPGTAVLFGQVPEGLELVDFGLISPADRDRLSQALGAVGNLATVAGNVGNAVASAQGLYRVTDATLALLNNGAQLAAKDGASLGAMFANGKLIGQARFVPYGVTAAQAVAAIGPAIAMLAIQMQLSEVSGLVRANMALTTQTLESIRREQWAELSGLTKAIDRAIDEATEVRSVTRLIWEDVAGSSKELDKQVDLYKQNVKAHARKLGSTRGTGRRQYLEANAEAIAFDANALLHSLKAHMGYQALRAARAQLEGADDAGEAQLAEVIAKNARSEFESSLADAGELLVALTRELRIIAELPGRATIPLTKKRRDGKAARLTCSQLLAAVEPLADSIHPPTPEIVAPEIVCAPDGLSIDPYLRVLRWFMQDGETVQGLAFPYQLGAHDFVDAVPGLLQRRVDAAWSGLEDGRRGTIVDKVASCTIVAVTDRRVITAGARTFRMQGEIEETFPLGDVRYVRTSSDSQRSHRASIDITTPRTDVRWIFSTSASSDAVSRIASMIAEHMSIPDDERSLDESAPRPVIESKSEQHGAAEVP